jgi:1,4-alpha-glucan branching enzyme
LRIPAPDAKKVEMRFAPLAQRDKFAPAGWPVRQLASARPAFPGWWQIDIDALGLADGAYEYEFILDGQAGRPVSDPFADEITRFGGYRGVFSISAGQRVGPAFRWDDEFTPGKPLPQNNAVVIYEMPVKWMTSDPDENPLVELGTLERIIFEQLDRLAASGSTASSCCRSKIRPRHSTGGMARAFSSPPITTWGRPSTRGSS